MNLSKAALADLIREYLSAHTHMYFAPGRDAGDYEIEGTLNLNDMAEWLASGIDHCPCDCTTGEFVGRWTSGDFTGTAPLRSAWTCAAHSEQVRAWCLLGTGVTPEWKAAG